MTLERVRAPKTEVFSPEAFTQELFYASLRWLVKKQNGRILAKIQPQEVSDWESREEFPGRTTQFGIDIDNGVLLETDRHYVALILGKRLWNKGEEEPTLGMQFGLLPKSSRKDFGRDPVKDAKRLVHQAWDRGSGRFYVDEIFPDRVTVDCWANSSRFGGPEIDRQPSKETLTRNGLDGYVGIIKRVFQNAFT